MQTSQFLQRRGSFLLSTLLITTLIIPLGTVGFVSIQDYTKDAKAATNRQYISILTNEINQKGASALDMITLINSESVDKTVHVNSQKTIFGESSMEKLITKAGDVNWQTLSTKYVSPNDVLDQYGNMPLVGYASNSQRSSLQVATTIDNLVYVKGNFNPDNGGENAAKGLIQDPSGTSELMDGTSGKHR